MRLQFCNLAILTVNAFFNFHNTKVYSKDQVLLQLSCDLQLARPILTISLEQ